MVLSTMIPPYYGPPQNDRRRQTAENSPFLRRSAVVRLWSFCGDQRSFFNFEDDDGRIVHQRLAFGEFMQPVSYFLDQIGG